MKEVPLSEVKDHLSEYLHLAEEESIIITRHGKPAGVLVGFATEDDWFDYRLEHDERFLARIAKARESLRTGKGIRLEEITVGEMVPPEYQSD
jgi:prevent-host-death family protein